MGWIADLLKEIPSAARYKAELEQMEKENAALKVENSTLKSQLQSLRDEADRNKAAGGGIGEAAEKILVFISRNEDATSAEIARALSISKGVAEMHIEDLMASRHIDASYVVGQEPEYHLEQVGRRLLHSKGLL